jgi:hypothetical protein
VAVYVVKEPFESAGIYGCKKASYDKWVQVHGDVASRQGFRIRRHEARGRFQVDPDKDAVSRQRQAGGLDGAGPGNMPGETSVRGMDWVRLIIKESFLRKAFRHLNPPTGLRQRARQTSGEAGAGGRLRWVGN